MKLLIKKSKWAILSKKENFQTRKINRKKREKHNGKSANQENSNHYYVCTKHKTICKGQTDGTAKKIDKSRIWLETATFL